MPNNLGLAGATAQKQVRFSALFTSRFFSGLWTNRSPLRDATTSRIVEKFYGQAGDALIAGTNVEISTKLTMVRRPGHTTLDGNTYTAVNSFYEFKLFAPNIEQITVMIDEVSGLWAWKGGTKTNVYTKVAGQGQSYMQSVGNILYIGVGGSQPGGVFAGVGQEKWLQTLYTWQANAAVGAGTSPFLSTYVIDVHGSSYALQYIQQLLGTAIPYTSITVNAPTATTPPTVTFTSSIGLGTLLPAGTIVSYYSTIFGNATSTVLSTSGTTMVLSYPSNVNVLFSGTYTPAGGHYAYAINGGHPVTGATIPTFSTVTPNETNSFTGGLTIDNTALWVNRGITLEHWGIDNSQALPLTAVPSSFTADLISSGFNTQIPAYVLGTTYTGPVYVTDPLGNIQYSAAGGTTGTIIPTFSTILAQTTTDGSITWTVVYTTAISASNGGWRYAVALVNSLDGTVSNCCPLSPATGNFSGAQGVFLNGGIPTAAYSLFGGVVSPIDVQADYVAIFRTTDGQNVPFLIPGQNGQTWTVPLAQYLAQGYNDTTPDTGLNNLIQGPVQQENTIPAPGAINLALHLGSIWYSIGNVVYWTTGAALGSVAGNGLTGTAPLNFDSLPSLVTRLVPVAAGMLVFTISDIFIITGSNTASSPLQPALPILPGIGLLSYNALALNGSLIGLFTTDNQFLILDPSAGTTYAGMPIGDQLLLNNGNPGQSWNPSDVYVAWHVQGMDQGWYICDGVNGWYKLIATPSPEGPGYTWSPFATIVGGANSIQSVEITPGVHRLLVGPTGTGPILERNLGVWTDNGTPYPANATIGSAVLAQPGQIAEVAFITTDSIRIGTPLYLGLLINEALPYYKGPIDYIKEWEADPPNFPESQSFYAQRFYLANMNDEIPAMRHLQMQIVFSPYDTVQNELNTVTIFGTFSQEL